MIIEDLPIGYAYHKIICDHIERPVDYEYIEVNSAFERYTGLNRTEILGKKVCDVLPGILDDKFNWIQEYGKVALNGEKKEFEQYSLFLNKWFRISVYSPEKFYFVTLFVDITKDVKELHEQRLLISVADAYEAMTADRPYRKSISKLEAAQELSRNSGKQFDPEIVQVFIEKVLNLKSICRDS